MECRVLRRFLAAASGAALFAAASLGQAAAPMYRITDLGDLPGGLDVSIAYGINSAGQVVGYSGAATGARAFLWQSGGGMTDLGDLPGGGDYSVAVGINNAGQVVGQSAAATGSPAFLWQSGSGMTDLGDLPGGLDVSIAYGINSAGQVVGYSAAATGDRAFLWQSGSGMTDLGDLPGGVDRSVALGINNAGQVVGHSEAATGTRAFLWQSGSGMTDLGDLPGGGDQSVALGINNAGQVVGYSGAATGTRAFLWQSGSGMTDLGDLPGGVDASGAAGINNAGQVVGYSFTAAGQSAFIWTAGDGMLNLNDLVDPLDPLKATTFLTYADGINDLGQIVGQGAFAGVGHAFLLTPVPEPSTFALLLGGLGILLMTGRLRNRRNPKGGAEDRNPRQDELTTVYQLCKRDILSVAAALALGFLSSTAGASTVIYDNQAIVNGGVQSDADNIPFSTADDFVLPAGTGAIGGVSWTGTYFYYGTVTEPDDFTVQLYLDDNGKPGALLDTYAVEGANRTDTGLNVTILGSPRKLFAYTATLPALTLTAGVPYWISIVNDTAQDATDNWDWSMQANSGNSWGRQATAGAWNISMGHRMDFQVSAVPEPSTATLMLAGVAAIAAVAKRRG